MLIRVCFVCLCVVQEEAESRQREFEKLLDEHAELVQEISRTPSSENLIQGERDH